MLAIAEAEDFDYAGVDGLGRYRTDDSFQTRHVEAVMALPLVDAEAVRKAGFRVCVDAINSVGGLILPELLDRLGVRYTMLNGEPTGDFAHNPEPLEKNLGGIMAEVGSGGYDLGIVVDPDVDRLAFICEDGRMFGEEYTLVSVADYVLGRTPGNTVSNLECHYGRDALVGIALFLSSLAQKGCKASQLRASLPNYFMAKNRIDLTPGTDIDAILSRVKQIYKDEKVDDTDGVKIDFADKWVHLRKSNTEPIIRIYSEAQSPEEAEAIAKQVTEAAMEIKS